MSVLNKLEIWALNYIAKKLVKQGGHQAGIIYFYSVAGNVAREEFIEDTKPILDQFLTDCHKYSLEPKGNHLWVAADNHAVTGGLVCMNCGKVKAT